MGYLSILGLTINSVSTRENDKYLLYLTDKFGKISVKFRSVRSITSKRIGYTEEFVLEKVLLYKKGNTFVATEVSFVKDFPLLKSNFSKMLVLLYIKELLILFLPFEEEEPQMFKFLLNTLDFLDANSEELSQSVLLYFMLRFLKFIGYPINIPTNLKDRIFFSSEENGFNSVGGFPINQEVYKEALLINNLSDINEIRKPFNYVKDILDLVNYYIINKFESKEYEKFLESIKKIER